MQKDKTSFRITFTEEDAQFVNDYKDIYGASIQFFVETAVKNRIQEIKLKQELGEL